MADRLAGIVGDKVLFRHISHIIALVVFRQKVVKRLILVRAHLFGDGLVPVLGIGKHGVHIENHPAEGMFPVAHNLAQMIFRTRF